MGPAHCYPVGPAWASHVGGLWLHGQELGGPSTPGLAFKAILCWAFSSSCPGRPPTPPHTGGVVMPTWNYFPGEALVSWTCTWWPRGAKPWLECLNID